MPTWRQQGLEELPALSVRRGHLRRSLRYVTGGYVFAMLWLACCSGAHIISYLRMAGFGNREFGWLGAVSFIATLGQLIAAVIVERTGLKKFQFIQCATVSRSLWAVVAAVPLVFAFPSPWAAWGILFVLIASSFAGALSTPAWYTWMGDLIPKRIRGRYWGRRARIGALVQIPVLIAVGVLMDAVSDPNAHADEVQPLYLRTICIVLVAGAALGVADIMLFRKIRDVLPRLKSPDPQPAPPPPLGLKDMLVTPMQDSVFRHYVLYGATITFSAIVGSSFFWLHAMEKMGFSKLATNVLFLVLPPIASMSAVRGWGRLIDRWGRKPVLIVATLCTLPSMIPWLLISRDMAGPAFLTEWPNAAVRFVTGLVGVEGGDWIAPGAPVAAYLLVCCGTVVGGAAWSGVGMAQEQVLMGFADGRGRSKFIAVSSVVIGVGGILGGVIGGQIAQGLEGLQSHPLPWFGWNNWQVVFVVSLLSRGLSVLWLLGMPEPGAGPIREVVHQMATNVYNAVSSRLFYPLRTFGAGRRRDVRVVRKRPKRERK